jgi:hypothetical protein
VLGQDRDNNRWIFGPLALVDRHGIGWHERIEFAEAIGDIAAIESDNQFTRVLVDVIDVANVAIVDLLVIVVLDLHDLVARRKGPAEALHLAIA